MGLAGAGGGGAATSGLSMWFGGVLQMLACTMEWFLGNTFSFLVFGTFGERLSHQQQIKDVWLTSTQAQRGLPCRLLRQHRTPLSQQPKRAA